MIQRKKTDRELWADLVLAFAAFQRRQMEKENSQERMAGEQAKLVLRRKGWTYRAAAERLGVHFTSLARILNGRFSNKRTPDARRIRLRSQAYSF